MAKTSVELREDRATQIAEARKTLEAAEAREGGVTKEDSDAFDRAMDGADKLLERAKRLERLETAEDGLDKPAERSSEPPDGPVEEERQQRQHKRSACRREFQGWLRNGQVGKAMREDQRRASGREFRDTVISVDSQGGYLITPVEVSADIVSQLDNLVFIRELCRKSGSITTVTSAQKLGIRTKQTRMSEAQWTTEVGPVTEDTAMTFGRRDLEPHQLTKLALVSLRTLMLSSDAEPEVKGELEYQFSITEENAYMTGDGSGQPLGIFTPGSNGNGITTAQDITTASNSVISGDDLINAKFSLRQVYLSGPSVSWVFHRNIVSQIRKIKMSSEAGFGDQNYVWQPGLTEGAPDRVLDVQYAMSEYAPSVIAPSAYVAVLGNFRYYRIAELADVALQRLVEKYADTGQVGFLGRRWLDGMPVLGEAFARVIMHS